MSPFYCYRQMSYTHGRKMSINSFNVLIVGQWTFRVYFCVSFLCLSNLPPVSYKFKKKRLLSKMKLSWKVTFFKWQWVVSFLDWGRHVTQIKTTDRYDPFLLGQCFLIGAQAKRKVSSSTAHQTQDLSSWSSGKKNVYLVGNVCRQLLCTPSSCNSIICLRIK